MPAGAAGLAGFGEVAAGTAAEFGDPDAAVEPLSPPPPPQPLKAMQPARARDHAAQRRCGRERRMQRYARYIKEFS